MKNQKVRLMAKGSGIALWEVARALGISEATLTRRLRMPISLEQEKEIVDIINKLKKRNGE